MLRHQLRCQYLAEKRKSGGHLCQVGGHCYCNLFITTVNDEGLFVRSHAHGPQILELERATPHAEPPGLDFTQKSPVQRCESLPMLHSKCFGSTLVTEYLKEYRMQRQSPPRSVRLYSLQIYIYIYIYTYTWLYSIAFALVRFEQTPALFEMTQPHKGKAQLSVRQARPIFCFVPRFGVRKLRSENA